VPTKLFERVKRGRRVRDGTCFSDFRRILAFQLLAAQLRVEVREKFASEIAWMTAERTRRDQPRGKGILGGSVRPAMKASGKRIWVDLFRG
jgi:hypothetical protein